MGATWGLVINREGGRSKEGDGLLRSKSGRAGDAIKAKENPAGVNLRGMWWVSRLVSS